MWRLKPFCIARWNVNDAAAIENSLVVPQKLIIELPCDPAISPLRINPKEYKTGLKQVLVCKCSLC